MHGIILILSMHGVQHACSPIATQNKLMDNNIHIDTLALYLRDLCYISEYCHNNIIDVGEHKIKFSGEHIMPPDRP